MKKILIVFAALFVFFNGVAQDNRNVREIGVVFSNDEVFGLTYRFGKERSLWRIGTAFLNVRALDYFSDVYQINQTNSSLRFDFGREFRKEIAPKLDFKYGASAFFDWARNKSYSEHEFAGEVIDFHTKGASFSPGLNLIVGLSYQFKQFVFGAELQPRCAYQKATYDFTFTNRPQQTYSAMQFVWGFYSSPVLLSAVYQF